MPELKPGWRRVRFGEVVRLCRETCKDPTAEGIERYIGLEHIEPDDLRVRSWGDVSDGTTFTNRVRPGQVLFGKRRAYQRKVAVADFDAVCSGDIYVFESANPGRLLPELLPFLCQTDAFFEYAVGTSAGSLSPRTNWSSLAEYELALPPLEGQRRLSLRLRATNDLSDALSRAERTTETLRDSTIFSLYTGASECTSRHSTPIGKLPTTWQVEPLGSRFSIQLGKMMSEDARGGPNPIPYIRNANVQWNRLDLSDVAHMSFNEMEQRKFSLRYGDILACEGRHVGKSALWRDEIPGACYQKALHRIRALGQDCAEFLLHCMYFYSKSGRFTAETGETTIPHLPAERLRAMLFPFPPIDEQREIARTVATIDNTLSSIRARKEHLAAQGLSRLMDGAQ